MQYAISFDGNTLTWVATPIGGGEAVRSSLPASGYEWFTHQPFQTGFYSSGLMPSQDGGHTSWAIYKSIASTGESVEIFSVSINPGTMVFRYGVFCDPTGDNFRAYIEFSDPLVGEYWVRVVSLDGGKTVSASEIPSFAFEFPDGTILSESETEIFGFGQPSNFLSGRPDEQVETPSGENLVPDEASAIYWDLAYGRLFSKHTGRSRLVAYYVYVNGNLVIFELPDPLNPWRMLLNVSGEGVPNVPGEWGPNVVLSLDGSFCTRTNIPPDTMFIVGSGPGRKSFWTAFVGTEEV